MNAKPPTKSREETGKIVSEPALKRLPLYHRFLKERQAAGHETVSCTDIGQSLDLDPTQVRKDLESVGAVGRPRIGYVLNVLVQELEQFLGWNNVNDAFLVGAGSMGAALMGYRKFEQCGLKIVAAFDVDPAKIGVRVHGRHVLALDKLANLAQRMHILIGIITVPAVEAQAAADLLVAGGIRAIWNFAPVRLLTPDHVIVHNEDLYCSVAALSQKLVATLNRQPAKPAPAPALKTTGVAAPFN